MTKFEQRLRETFPDDADRVLAVIRGTREHALTYPSAAKRDRESYHPHETYTLKLEAINEIIGTYGVEYIPEGNGDRSPAIEYCNTGDSYGTTILFFPDRMSWRVDAWGDIVEAGDYERPIHGTRRAPPQE